MNDNARTDDQGGEVGEMVLVFKHEAEVGGEPIGPALVLPVSPAGAEMEMVPIVRHCVCRRPLGSPWERCGRCANEIAEPWMTLSEARARARELGIEMKEA